MDGSITESKRMASERFQFRFVARGDYANALVVFAVESLRRCHPNVGILVIDANDSPILARTAFGRCQHPTTVHVPPGEDEISRVVGRGSPRHLFYWRHSPQVLNALPSSDRYAVDADCDIVFLRPMDLRSLLGPLARGRIAATVDESSLDYYRKLGMGATASVAAERRAQRGSVPATRAVVHRPPRQHCHRLCGSAPAYGGDR
jgi:hypothetical protein